MRKLAMLLMLCLLAGLLCACGAQETAKPAATQAPAQTQTPAPAPAQTAAPAATEAPKPAATPAATPESAPAETPAPVNEKLEAALALVGKTTDELFAAVGMPNESDYAPSCLGPGEDGNLYYDDFTVYTYRENGVEKIRIVE